MKRLVTHSSLNVCYVQRKQFESRRPQHFAIGVLIIHFDQHVGDILGAAEVAVGWPVAIVALLGTGYLTIDQLVLLARGETSLGRMKQRRLRQQKNLGSR